MFFPEFYLVCYLSRGFSLADQKVDEKESEKKLVKKEENKDIKDEAKKDDKKEEGKDDKDKSPKDKKPLRKDDRPPRKDDKGKLEQIVTSVIFSDRKIKYTQIAHFELNLVYRNCFYVYLKVICCIGGGGGCAKDNLNF